MTKEIWKDIKGFEGKYQVSNKGNVRSLKYNQQNVIKNIKPVLKKGYWHVCLYKYNQCKLYPIHRLVGIAFIPNPNNLPIINHKDEVKTNNNVDNLEWCTNEYNLNYGTARERAKLNHHKMINSYNLNGEYLKTYYSVTEAKKDLNISGISNVLKGRYKHCGGYTFRYYDGDINDIEPIVITPKINCFSVDGKYITTYNTINEASNETGCSISSIKSNINNNVSYNKNGFIFRYYDGEVNNIIIQNVIIKLPTAIKAYYKGDYIGTFNNQHEAARELNIKQSKVADILIGRRKSNHGYSFRYVTN